MTELTPKLLRAKIHELERNYQKLQEQYDDGCLLSRHLAEYLARRNFTLCRDLGHPPPVCRIGKSGVMQHLQAVLNGDP